MPTQKRRMSVTLEDEQYAVLHRLADLSKQSMGSIVGELIESALPTLSRMLEAMEAYQAADESKQREMLSNLEAAHADLLPDAGEVLRRSEDVWSSVTGKKP